MSRPPSMHSQHTPHVVNNGLIDFQDTSAALYQAVCQQQAAQHQALMAQGYLAPAQLPGALASGPGGYSSVNAPPNGPTAPYPGQPAYPGHPGATALPAYPGVAPVYPASVPATAAAAGGVVTGPPSFIEVNGVKYKQESAAPKPAVAARRTEEDLERSIKSRVDQRVEEFMSRRGASVGARASGGRRAAASTASSAAEDPLVAELRKLNERMSRVAGSSKSRS